MDFRTITKGELQDIVIPFTWVSQFTGLVHGIAAWFDINLGGYILSTAPHAEKTHWHQVRLLLKEPLAVNAFESMTGWLRMVANPKRSYDITAEIVTGTQTPSDPKAPSEQLRYILLIEIFRLDSVEGLEIGLCTNKRIILKIQCWVRIRLPSTPVYTSQIWKNNNFVPLPVVFL